MSDFINANDLGGQLEKKQAIPSQSVTADVMGTEVDISDCSGRMVTVFVNVGTVTAADANNYCTVKVFQATALGGSYSEIDSDNYAPLTPTGSTTVWDRLINATIQGDVTYSMNIHLTRTYDYLEVRLAETGTFQALMSADFVYVPREQPAATQ